MQLHLVLGSSILFLATCLFLPAEEVPPDALPKLKSIYGQVDATLRSDSKTYQATSPVALADGNFGILPESWTPKTYRGGPDGGAWMHVWADSLRLRMVLNVPLNQLIDQKKITQSVPSLTLDKAVDAAKNYLSSFHLNLDSNLQLTIASFNSNYPACWEIRWTRVDGGYPWDDFSPPSRESLVVVFHEKEGLLCLEDKIYSPMPKSLNVAMTREAAISKAAMCAPLVERTPFYKSARLDGFVVDEMKSCDLKIAVPNYLLDPKRANWLSDTPPDETRLCWVVRFATVDSKDAQRPGPGKPIPPDIVIYLDAATGECVGANFS